ncbi:MAG: hypothetical protein HZB59_11680 [Ignavibacteriales bacterium]|nr:hypothetical protein [Ignavibacteriales bacterium]
MSKISVISIVVFSAIVLAGCSHKWKAEISSNTSWHGQFGTGSKNSGSSRTVDGSGNQTINVSDDVKAWCFVQKQTSGGYLKVRLKDEGGGLFGIAAGETREAETNSPYGSVTLESDAGTGN